MIALPGERQSHSHATPTGGGLGLVFSIVITTLCLELIISLPVFWWQNMLPGCTVIALVGWRDDKHPVSSFVRLVVQLAVSIWLIGFGWMEFSLKDIVYLGGVILAMVWLMNVYNFMDGSNGMAGFQGVFAGLVMAVLFQAGGEQAMALIALAVAAACAGFSTVKFPECTGCLWAMYPVYRWASYSHHSPSLWAAYRQSEICLISILIMSVFLVDATLTLLARAFRGERWYTAHAQHVYQRLIALGWSHRQVLVLYQAINVFLVLPVIVLATIYPQYAIAMVGLTLLVLATGWHIANWRLGMTAEVRFK